MGVRRPSKDKWKSKVWYEILAPPEFGEKEVGETPASDPNMVVGRRVEVFANDLTGNIRQSNMKLLLEIEKVVGKTARTRVIGYELSRSYLRSIVRRRRRKIELIKDFKTKDGKSVRVKAVAITARKCHTSQAKDIRKVMGEVIEEKVKDMSFEELIKSVLNYELQKEMRAKAHKIYPIANMEIRKIELL